MSDVFEEPSVERLITGASYVLIFGLLTGLLGWAFTAVASQEAIGVGSKLLGYLTAATALNIIGYSISVGFHQALSKYISEALVESKEKALRYAKAGFLIFNILGLILFSIFITIAIVILPDNFGYGLIFTIMAVVYYLTFFKDNFIGNLAAVHRFDYIGKITFLAGVGSIVVAIGILFLLPRPINAYLLPLLIIVNTIIAIILVLHYSKKTLPYSLKSILKGARKKEIVQVFKYGLYCIIPSIIITCAILWIQSLYYMGIIGIESTIISANGLMLGYASIIFAICQFGWPQIPAVAEAKAMNDYKLIDDYMKNTLHTGFNLTAFFLVIYVGLAYQIFELFHGPEYIAINSHIPFILLSISVAILGVEFLICTLLMGLGKGKQAAYLITSLTLSQIIFVPFLIILLRNTIDLNATLYAGPVCLLIAAIAIFPVAFKYLKKNTTNPVKEYKDILWKGTVSVILTMLVYYLLELTLFSFNNLIIGLIIRAAILFGLFSFFMLVFAGYNDADLDVYGNIFGPFAFIVKGMKWLLHHSPFYEKIEEDTGINRGDNEEV